jgi:hypothetical protein
MSNDSMKDTLFWRLRIAYIRGAEWRDRNGSMELHEKASYDYADKITSPLTSIVEKVETPAQGNEHRGTFPIPPGHEAVRDDTGRATGEIRPKSPAPQDHLVGNNPYHREPSEDAREAALQAAADANVGYINGKTKQIVLAALNAFSIPSKEARHHAVELRQCAIFAADVGNSIAKAMTDAADFLDRAPSPQTNVQGWLPIETAPHSKPVLVFVPMADHPENLPAGSWIVAYKTFPEPPLMQTWRYAVGDFRGQQVGWPSHWMALPEPPTFSKEPRDCGVNGGDLSESRDNIGSAYTRSAPAPHTRALGGDE